MSAEGDRARALAAETPGHPTAWFERLYAQAARGTAAIPWDRGGPNPYVASWVDQAAPDGRGRRAVVIGSALGDDPELIASLGYRVTAFDISETAVATARARFPESTVEYRVADLLALPAEWLGAFDLVVESLTVQSMPRSVRTTAITAVASLVAPGGLLVVVSAAAPDPASTSPAVPDPPAAPDPQTAHTSLTAPDPPAALGPAAAPDPLPPPDPDAPEVPGSGPPWPLTRAEVESFATGGLTTRRITAPVSPDSGETRWLAEFTR